LLTTCFDQTRFSGGSLLVSDIKKNERPKAREQAIRVFRIQKQLDVKAGLMICIIKNNASQPKTTNLYQQKI
jgi:hypothetical protein